MELSENVDRKEKKKRARQKKDKKRSHEGKKTEHGRARTCNLLICLDLTPILNLLTEERKGSS